MGSVAVPSQGAIYFDANCFIYTVEQVPPYFQALVPIWQTVQSCRPSIFTSALTILETLVKPLKNNDSIIEQAYRTILTQSSEVTLEPISLFILERAAHLRATFGLKTPDSIHAATAIETGSTLFFTNDPTFRTLMKGDFSIFQAISKDYKR
jgi:predicted nucleic acid-binding protein